MFNSANYIIQVIAFLIFLAVPGCFSSPSGDDNANDSIIADHNVARLSVLQSIPDSAINSAKSKLHIAYGHTSHGSQIRTGMDNLDAFMGGSGLYSFYDITDGHPVLSGSLDFRDYYSDFGGAYTATSANDLGAPDRTAWAAATREYLNANSDVNVIVWSWCGQAATTTADIDIYLSLMEQLISDYPGVTFIFMTGHLDGTGVNGQLNLANEHIRKHCRAHGRWLFDFADIESYDPDGNYYLNKAANDECNYDSNGDGSRESNWAIAWQNSHTENVDWYICSSAHSQALNANMKAYAFWWLMARVAGWGG